MVPTKAMLGRSFLVTGHVPFDRAHAEAKLDSDAKGPELVRGESYPEAFDRGRLYDGFRVAGNVSIDAAIPVVGTAEPPARLPMAAASSRC